MSCAGSLFFSKSWRTLFPFLDEPTNLKLLDRAYEAARSLDGSMYKKYDAPDGDSVGDISHLIHIGRSFLKNTVKWNKDSNPSKAPSIRLERDDFTGQHILVEKTIDPGGKAYSLLWSAGSLQTAFLFLKKQHRLSLWLSQFFPHKWAQLVRQLEKDIPTALQLQRDIKTALGRAENWAKSSPVRNSARSPRGAPTERMRVELRPHGLARVYSSKQRRLLGSRLLTAAQRADKLADALKKAPTRGDASFTSPASWTVPRIWSRLLLSTADAIVDMTSSSNDIPFTVAPPRRGWGRWAFSADTQRLFMQLREDRSCDQWRYEAAATVKNRPDGGQEIGLKNGVVYRRRKGCLLWERVGFFKEME